MSPISRAIDRVDQFVACLGMVSSVLMINFSTCASVTVRGRPRPRLVDQAIEPALGKARTPLGHQRTRR